MFERLLRFIREQIKQGFSSYYSLYLEALFCPLRPPCWIESLSMSHWAFALMPWRAVLGPVSENGLVKPNLTIAELFYSHILGMKRGSLHTRSFGRIHFSVFTFRWTKNDFTGPKSFRGFRETGPWFHCWARHMSLLSRYQRAQCWGNPAMGGVELALFPSCHRNRDKLRLGGLVYLMQIYARTQNIVANPETNALNMKPSRISH